MSDEVMNTSGEIVLKSGSKSKVVVFLKTHLERSLGADGLGEVTLRLWRTGLDAGREQVACWEADKCAQRPGDWADEVIDLVRQRTEVAGSRCEFSLEAEAREEVIRSYPLVAQPSTQNLSPTNEGMVHLAMRHSAMAVQTMLQDRTAASDAYMQVIAAQRVEIDRLVRALERYAEREDEWRERELKLLDRERALLLKESESQADSRQRADDRIDRVVEKIGDAIEGATVEAARGAMERVGPEDAAKLLREFAPIIKTIIGE